MSAAGRRIDCLERAREIADKHPGDRNESLLFHISAMRRTISSGPWLFFVWRTFVSASGPAPELTFERLPFDLSALRDVSHRARQGLPKCMVHGAGGTLIQHIKELSLPHRRETR